MLRALLLFEATRILDFTQTSCCQNSARVNKHTLKSQRLWEQRMLHAGSSPKQGFDPGLQRQSVVPFLPSLRQRSPKWAHEEAMPPHAEARTPRTKPALAQEMRPLIRAIFELALRKEEESAAVELWCRSSSGPSKPRKPRYCRAYTFSWLPPCLYGTTQLLRDEPKYRRFLNP